VVDFSITPIVYTSLIPSSLISIQEIVGIKVYNTESHDYDASGDIIRA